MDLGDFEITTIMDKVCLGCVGKAVEQSGVDVLDGYGVTIAIEFKRILVQYVVIVASTECDSDDHNA